MEESAGHQGSVSRRELLVKTDRQYRRYLAIIAKLASTDPDPKSAAGARLELLAKLVEDYEKVRFPIDKPDALSRHLHIPAELLAR